MSNLTPYTSILQKLQGLCSLIHFTPWCLWRHCMTSLHNANPWMFLVRLTVCLTHVLKRQETRRTFLFTCPYQANTESPSLASIAVTSAIAMFFVSRFEGENLVLGSEGRILIRLDCSFTDISSPSWPAKWSRVYQGQSLEQDVGGQGEVIYFLGDVTESLKISRCRRHT